MDNSDICSGPFWEALGRHNMMWFEMFCVLLLFTPVTWRNFLRTSRCTGQKWSPWHALWSMAFALCGGFACWKPTFWRPLSCPGDGKNLRELKSRYFNLCNRSRMILHCFDFGFWRWKKAQRYHRLSYWALSDAQLQGAEKALWPAWCGLHWWTWCCRDGVRIQLGEDQKVRAKVLPISCNDPVFGVALCHYASKFWFVQAIWSHDSVWKWKT